MNKKVVLSLIVFIAGYGLCMAQSAEKIEEIINSEILSKGQACYLVGTASGKVDEKESYGDAFKNYSNLKMFKNASSDEPIKLGEFSNLILQTAEIRVGLWYKISKTPYYALRYLKLKGIIGKNAVGSAPITPMQAFDILSKIEIAAPLKGDTENEKN